MDCDILYNGATVDGVKAITDALELSAYEHKKLERHQKLSEPTDLYITVDGKEYHIILKETEEE